MSRYDPWSDLAARRPHVRVICRHSLPGTMVGALDGDRIWLDRSLGQAARRATLAHEIVHLDRGRPEGDERAIRREEVRVEAIAARRLISLDELIDACRWAPGAGNDVLAELLWVDAHIVAARLGSLTDDERRVVARAVTGE